MCCGGMVDAIQLVEKLAKTVAAIEKHRRVIHPEVVQVSNPANTKHNVLFVRNG